MASQQKLGLRAKRWLGIGRADHHHPAVHGTHLIDWDSCVEVHPDAVIWKLWVALQRSDIRVLMDRFLFEQELPQESGVAVMSGKTDKVKGRIKEAAGALTGNDKLREEGKTDQAVGEVKEAVQKVADKVKNAVKKAIG